MVAQILQRNDDSLRADDVVIVIAFIAGATRLSLSGAIATGRKSATTVWSLATRTIAQRLRRRLSQHRRSQPEATKFMAATTTQSVAITCAQIATIPTN